MPFPPEFEGTVQPPQRPCRQAGTYADFQERSKANATSDGMGMLPLLFSALRKQMWATRPCCCSGAMAACSTRLAKPVMVSHRSSLTGQAPHQRSHIRMERSRLYCTRPLSTSSRPVRPVVKAPVQARSKCTAICAFPAAAAKPPVEVSARTCAGRNGCSALPLPIFDG